MSIKITEFRDIDPRQLMDIYTESNLENTGFFFPDETDKAVATRKVEEGHLGFLENDFLTQDGSSLWVLEEDGVWVSALRLSRIEPDLYFLEALETKPDQRGKGYARLLLTDVVDALRQDGPFRLCCCVAKTNGASLRAHQKAGFEVVSESGYDYLLGEADDRDFGLEYRFQPDKVSHMP